MKKIFTFMAAMLVAFAVNADPVALPAVLDVTNVSFRSEGMPDFVLTEGDYAGTYFDMGAHDSANDTLLYAEWDVTIESIQYNLAVDVYNTNSWRVQLYVLNQTGDTVKSLRYKGSSGQCGHYPIGSIDMRDLEAGNYKVRAHAATAWSAMKLKDVIFEADYSGVTVALPGTLLPAYAELSANASLTDGAIAFKPSTAPDEYANWNVSFAEAGTYNVTIDITASNGHNYGVELIGEDEETSYGAVNEGGQKGDTGIKELGTITVPAAGNYIVHLTNATQWSEAVLNSITFAGEAAPADTYTVAGDNVDVFGTSWDPTNTANDMFLQEDQTYKWEKTGLTLPAGSIQFKVVKNHDWNNGANAYPAGNYVLNIPEAGIYTIDIYYNPNDNNYVGAVATKTGEAVVIPSIAMHGNFTGTWKDTENFTIAEGNATASLTMNIEAGNYEFGMRIGGPGNWTSNGVAFTRENNSAEIVADQGNLTLAADLAGDYTFTWTYETNTLAITFPAATPVVEEWDEIVFTEVAAKGSLNGAVFASATNANFTLTVTDTDASKVEIDANTARFGTPEAFKDYTHRLKTGGKSGSKNLLTLAIPAAGTLRVAVRTGSNSDNTRTLVLTQGTNELYNQVVKEDDKQEIDNTNYYPYVEVAVEAGNVVVTYPVNSINFYAFGFKAAQSGTGIEETIAEKKAVKMIENGQLVIIKNGVRYNVMGAVLR